MRRSLPLALVLVAACSGAPAGGGPTSGLATVNGTIKGASLVAADAIAGTDATGSSGAVAIVSTSATCMLVTQGKRPKGQQAIYLTLADVVSPGSTKAPSAPATYTIGGPLHKATVSYVATDAACAQTTTAATSGTVTLTDVNANGWGGSADLTFDGGDHVTATFVAQTCPAFTGQTAGSCM
jgi:hypothetical protein